MASSSEPPVTATAAAAAEAAAKANEEAAAEDPVVAATPLARRLRLATNPPEQRAFEENHAMVRDPSIGNEHRKRVGKFQAEAINRGKIVQSPLPQ